MLEIHQNDILAQSLPNELVLNFVEKSRCRQGKAVDFILSLPPPRSVSGNTLTFFFNKNQRQLHFLTHSCPYQLQFWNCRSVFMSSETVECTGWQKYIMSPFKVTLLHKYKSNRNKILYIYSQVHRDNTNKKLFKSVSFSFRSHW